MIAQLAVALSSSRLAARLEAAESLLDAAEEGADLTPALAALGTALSDPDGDVRECAAEALAFHVRTGGAPGGAVAGLVQALGDGDLALVAGECLRDSLGGPDGLTIRTSLQASLGGDALLARNAAGLLARSWLLAGESDEAVALLSHERDLIRQGAFEAAVAAVRTGRDVTGILGALSDRLTDGGQGIARRAAWLLARHDPGQLPMLLAHARSEVRFGTLAALAEGCDAGQMPAVDHAPIRSCLADPVPDIRQKAAYVFAALARAGASLVDSVPALSAALRDASPDVRHEAVLALLWLARAGQDLSTADIPAVLDSGGVRLRRTAAMAWGRHLLNQSDSDGMEALLTTADRHIRFGAAWGMAERHLVRMDAGELLGLLQRPDRLIAEAVVATMRQFREEGRNVSAGLTALHLLQTGGLMDGARAQGLFAEFLRG